MCKRARRNKRYVTTLIILGNIDRSCNLAGDSHLLTLQRDLRPFILTGQLRNDILNFDFDAFITAVIRYYYKESVFIHFLFDGFVIEAFAMWMPILSTAVRSTFNHNLHSLIS
jgi:hypothetical protein